MGIPIISDIYNWLAGGGGATPPQPTAGETPPMTPQAPVDISPTGMPLTPQQQQQQLQLPQSNLSNIGNAPVWNPLLGFERDRGPAIDPATKEGILAPLPPVNLGRLGSAEEQAQRSQLARQLMAEQQAGSRQLLAQQAKQGIRGGAAVAQQSQLAQRIAAQRAAQEEQGLLQRTMFNLQQQQREQFARVSNELARRQLGATLAGQEAQVASAREFARAQIAAARD